MTDTTVTLVPLPLVRKLWREAVGTILSGDATTESSRRLAWRFIRQWAPVMRGARHLTVRDLRGPVGGDVA